MSSPLRSAFAALLLTAASTLAGEEVPLANWPAPPYWSPPALPPEAMQSERPGDRFALQTLALPSPPLPFVAIAPCRLADTRVSGGLSGQWGPPSIAGGGTQRTFTIVGQCTIPADAQAVSFNFAVWAPVTRGDLRVFPAGGGTPIVSTLNWEAGILALANAAVVPLGTGAAITVQVDGSGTVDIFFDVNGYYSPQGVVNSVTAGTGLAGGGTGNVTLGIAPGGVTSTELAPNAVTQPKIASNAITAGAIASGQVVKSLNGLADSVTLAGAGGASVTQLGQTITVTAPPGLPSGISGQTLRHNGTNWLANSLLFNNGTRIGIGTTSPNEQLEITGNLRIPATTSTTGQIWLGDHTFIHILGTNNTFVGSAAGNLTLTGQTNTGVGYYSLSSNSSGTSNTAVGNESLRNNSTAIGNTAVGSGALRVQSFSNGGVGWNSENTAVGWRSLESNQPTSASTGYGNTALGSYALQQNTTGNQSVAIGQAALGNCNAGTENTAVGSEALKLGTTGSYNVGIGRWALTYNVGDKNTAAGYVALQHNNVGALNVALGAGASLLNQNGNGNTAVGTDSLHQGVSGSGNVALGYMAGYNETGSNRLYIANSDTNTLIYGQFDNNLVAVAATDPATTLDVNGTFRVRNLPLIGGGNPVCAGFMNVFGFCGASDARLKKNVVSLSEERDVLSGLARLRAVSFDWNLSPGMVAGREGRDLGVIAQEVETVLPEVVSTNPGGYKSVDYSKLTAFLIEVAKVQQKEIDQQRAELDDLKALVRQLAATR